MSTPVAPIDNPAPDDLCARCGRALPVGMPARWVNGVGWVCVGHMPPRRAATFTISGAVATPPVPHPHRETDSQ